MWFTEKRYAKHLNKAKYSSWIYPLSTMIDFRYAFHYSVLRKTHWTDILGSFWALSPRLKGHTIWKSTKITLLNRRGVNMNLGICIMNGASRPSRLTGINLCLRPMVPSRAHEMFTWQGRQNCGKEPHRDFTHPHTKPDLMPNRF